MDMHVATLDSLNVGEEGMVISIEGGRTASKRLYEMGFNRGSQVQIVKNDVGPIIVSLSGSKIAIGWGLANKIIVSTEGID